MYMILKEVELKSDLWFEWTCLKVQCYAFGNTLTDCLGSECILMEFSDDL
jgi:hypothetical protein